MIQIGSTRLRYVKVRSLFGRRPITSEPTPGATTTLVRGDARPLPESASELHPQLKAQLRELQLRTGSERPDVPMLLRLINEHYQTIDARAPRHRRVHAPHGR